jgi:hypothetical protein
MQKQGVNGMKNKVEVAQEIRRDTPLIQGLTIATMVELQEYALDIRDILLYDKIEAQIQARIQALGLGR